MWSYKRNFIDVVSMYFYTRLYINIHKRLYRINYQSCFKRGKDKFFSSRFSFTSILYKRGHRVEDD